MAKVYGLEIPDSQADDIKTAWRDANPLIVEFWYRLERAAMAAVKHPGRIYHAGQHIRFCMVEGNLLMRLPSGRYLFYRDAKIGVGTFGNEAVSYMGVNQFTRRWERETTYGGKLAENATQAVARDVMAEAFLRVGAIPGVDILGTVHDEILFEFNTPGQFGQVELLMNTPPEWAQGLPVSATGYWGERFKKD
jgi:DNA polymerase